jgi:hypothetical protein
MKNKSFFTREGVNPPSFGNRPFRARFSVVIMAGFLVTQGCSFFDTPEAAPLPKGNSANGDQVELTYYSKDATANFLAFLQNPRAASSARSVLEPGESVEVTDADVFAGLWAALSEEERAQVLANPGAIDIEIDESISVGADSELGRAITARNAGVITELAGRFKLLAQLKDWFGDKEVPYTYAGIESGIVETVPANLAVQKLLGENDLKGVAVILHYFDMDNRFDDLKAVWEAVTDAESEDAAGQRSVARSGAGDLTYSTPLYTNLGATLQDGDVLVMSRTGSAYISGTYNHAGIFSKNAYNNNGKNDRAQCVYTAEPNINYDVAIRPDRPGYACLDTVTIYTHQKKAAVIRPKNYTEAKAATAIKYAKDTFYDKKIYYWLPVNEALLLGNTSHNNTFDAYCSKVVWHAWEKAGVDLDANNFVGFLIAPDELYDSSINRGISGCIKILGITIATWYIPTYSATSNVVRKMSR